MKVTETFSSLQGEGKYAGTPCLFVRLSGCSRSCSFCDTKYHSQFTEKSVNEMVSIIKESGMKTVVWTGGEPCLQIEEICEVIFQLKNPLIRHHLETNGDLLRWQLVFAFDYIAFSPKEKKSMDKVKAFVKEHWPIANFDFDIKVVTDLKLNKELIKDATMLMPITTKSALDPEIRKKVWDYCVKNDKRYSPRLHYEIFGVKRGK